MDKEDCIQTLLSTLQKPQWKSSNSVTDWDLKNILWEAGLLLTPEQVAALLADIRRRGLVAGRERRADNRIVALWGVKLTTAGEEWLAQRAAASADALHRPQQPPTPAAAPPPKEPESQSVQDPSEPMEASLR